MYTLLYNYIHTHAYIYTNYINQHLVENAERKRKNFELNIH